MNVRSIVDDSYFVNDGSWVVSLVCKKGAEHGFLLIQGSEGGLSQFWRSDLFLDDDQPLRNVGDTSGGKFAASFFKPEKADAIRGMPWDGKALIKLLEKDQAYFEALCAEDRGLQQQTWRITADQGRRLMQAIDADTQKNIRYILAGNGSSWSSVISQCGNYHNCMSWAQKKLVEINIATGKTWHDWVVVQPSASARAGGGMCRLL